MKKFTLFELLIVVAILSILISILLPSIKRSRELSKRVVCMSNQAQFGKGFYIFAKMENNKLPVNVQSASPITGGRNEGTESIWNIYNTGLKHEGWAGHGQLFYLNIVEKEIFDCPSNTSYGDWSTKVGYKFVNGLMGGIPEDGDPIAAGVNNLASNYIYRGTIDIDSSGRNARAPSLVIDEGNTPIMADWFTDPRPDMERSVLFHHVEGYNVLSLDASARFFHEATSRPILYKNGNDTYHSTPPNFVKQEEVWEGYFRK